MKLMHAFVFCAQVLLSSLLRTEDIGTIQKSVAAIFVHMGLNMASWNDFLAAFSPKRALYPYIVAHIDQESRDVKVDPSCWRSTGRAFELVSTGRKGGDSSVQTFLAEHMIALQSHWAYVWTVAYCTHEMIVILGNIVQRAEVDNLIKVAARLHRKKLVDIHLAQVRPVRSAPDLYFSKALSLVVQVTINVGGDRERIVFRVAEGIPG
ncbi:hypothetical protein BDV32DRAFT_41972 [Aspergillus pseudonomiae]|uniref:Uncharacterized protein n=1 Tax=Aspergillus pseudonomiae TaxID=1506151 RepID=A0A5N7DAW9_9EURO|nr:uncharacterized protein BDV37DRAFT_135746 [Aspergillus pseudonomiae]KAB8261082.1 hypothetical protein BDV32DRAFT_41972 [Aspergillus pseudonomiae]KAE8403497.1 hypothetical protein BDV37DRAFT_135746 [Aspergillus pseudonomiae]